MIIYLGPRLPYSKIFNAKTQATWSQQAHKIETQSISGRTTNPLNHKQRSASIMLPYTAIKLPINKFRLFERVETQLNIPASKIRYIENSKKVDLIVQISFFNENLNGRWCREVAPGVDRLRNEQYAMAHNNGDWHMEVTVKPNYRSHQWKQFHQSTTRVLNIWGTRQVSIRYQLKFTT